MKYYFKNTKDLLRAILSLLSLRENQETVFVFKWALCIKKSLKDCHVLDIYLHDGFRYLKFIKIRFVFK